MTDTVPDFPTVRVGPAMDPHRLRQARADVDLLRPVLGVEAGSGQWRDPKFELVWLRFVT